MIILNSSKGRSKLTPFDIKNIKGRAGRYYHCFVGRVFYMNKELVEIEESDDLKLDFATYADIELGPIDLDNAERADLSQQNQQIKDQRDQENQKLQLPYRVFIKNRLVMKEQQEQLMQCLMKNENLSKFENLITYPLNVDNFLKYNWLGKILSVFKEANLIDSYTLKKYNAVGLSYRDDGFLGILKYEIDINKRCKSVDQAYSNAFQTLRDIVEHKIPKILSLFESILVYVGTTKGYDMADFSLSKVTRFYETGVKTPVGESLTEFGFPLDAIRRMEKNLPPNIMSDAREAKRCCMETNCLDNLLDNYERKIIAKFFASYD